MELMDLVTKRQSVRKFTQQDVPMEDLLKMIDAAKYAPSGKNVQNWHFVITKNKELFEKIGEAILKKNETIASKMRLLDEDKANRFEKFAKNFTLFYKNAPALVLVFACDYFPSGYPEMTLIGSSKYETEKLFWRNPGMQNIGAAMENFTLRCMELGYGSCWMTSQNYAADEIEAIIKETGGFEKEDFHLAAMLAVGVPAGELKSPAKKTLEEIYTII